MSYLFYILLGLTPSIIWLLFYLRKDVHPEPKKMVLKIFFWGMLITVPVFLIEVGISGELAKLFPSILNQLLYWFIGIALVEEALKYLIVKDKVLKNPEFDEPVDIMLYMIIAALGFAALENIFVLLPGEKAFLFREAISITFIRFIGATFLHALCSGTVGYFLALSFFEPKKRLKLIAEGLGIATILHGLFNISIIEIGESLINKDFSLFIFLLILLIVILAGLALFVSSGFRKLKKLKSICKIKT